MYSSMALFVWLLATGFLTGLCECPHCAVAGFFPKEPSKEQGEGGDGAGSLGHTG